MELNDVLKAVRFKRRFIIGGLLLGLLVAGLLSWMTTPKYASSTELFVSVATAPGSSADPYNNDLFAQQRVVSYVQVLTSKELAQQVIQDLRLPMTPTQLTDEVTATPLPGTVVLEVTVTDTSPERAQAIAASLAREFKLRVNELETPDGATTSSVKVSTIQDATLNTTPVSPAVGRNLALGAAIGLLLGVGLALLRSRLDKSVRSDQELREAARTDLIGRVHEDLELSRRHVSSFLDGQSPTAEAFRAIRVNLQHGVTTGESPQVVVVTSAAPGDGSSTVAVNLAVSLARSGSRVMLLDGNLRRPRVARYLGLPDGGPGLSDVLNGAAPLSTATQIWRNSNLRVLGAGPLHGDPDALLGSPQMRSLLKVLRDSYDVVIIDTPPLLPVIDAAAVGAFADACVLVARYGSSQRPDLDEAVSAVARVHGRLLGVVFNRVPHAPAGAPLQDRLHRRSYKADPGRRSGGSVPAGTTTGPGGRKAAAREDKTVEPVAVPTGGEAGP